MAQTAAQLVNDVIARVPVRRWVLSLPTRLRLLPAAQPKRVTPLPQIVRRAITRFVLDQAIESAGRSKKPRDRCRWRG